MAQEISQDKGTLQMGKLIHWALAALLAATLALGVNTISFSDDTNPLPISLIQDVDELEVRVQSMVQMGLAEMPDVDWFDEKFAYYTALNVAWAQGDIDDVVFFTKKLSDLFAEVMADAAPMYGEPDAPKQDL